MGAAVWIGFICMTAILRKPNTHDQLASLKNYTDLLQQDIDRKLEVMAHKIGLQALPPPSPEIQRRKSELEDEMREKKEKTKKEKCNNSGNSSPRQLLKKAMVEKPSTLKNPMVEKPSTLKNPIVTPYPNMNLSIRRRSI